jgi:UDP-N-acetylglucosamine--N-acetylmuramyl-(pentapeptide) pyrophosphoryl-undecaprenol N-acetylglucosamine transferase
MKLLIAGGGTGGHLFPGMAVAEEFLARDPANRVLFVGTERGIEARAVPAAGYALELISAAGVRGKGGFSQLKAAAMMIYGYAQSRKVLKAFRPDFVLGVGGYASLPMVLAARGMQVPCFIHEQNAIPGMTNKLLARIARQVFITLEESEKFFPKDKILVTGNPLRRQILDSVESRVKGQGSSEEPGNAPLPLAPCPASFHLLVFGGSQGAHAINMAVVDALPALKMSGVKIEITHQTGEKDLEQIQAAYRREGVEAKVTAFISDMASEYAKADLIICRAGATTIAEVTACGKPCVFIPFPHAVDDHQRRNAEALLKKQACFMLLEHELRDGLLAATIADAINNPEQLRQTGAAAFSVARLDAAEIIVDEMTKYIR